MMEKHAVDLDVSIICCSEPNTSVVDDDGWFFDTEKTVAIKSERGAGGGTGHGFVWWEFKSFSVYSRYISPNVSESVYEEFLDALGDSIRSRKMSVLVVGDFNAWATAWGSRLTNKRGTLLLDWMDCIRLDLLNDGKTPTRRCGTQESYIDLTLCSSIIRRRVHKWKVMDELESLSDHLAIYMEISEETSANSQEDKMRRMRRYKPEHKWPLCHYLSSNVPPTPSMDEVCLCVEAACRTVIGVHS